MVSFIKILACVGLFGEQTLIIERGAFLFQHTLEGGPLRSIIRELGGKHV